MSGRDIYPRLLSVMVSSTVSVGSRELGTDTEHETVCAEVHISNADLSVSITWDVM